VKGSPEIKRKWWKFLKLLASTTSLKELHKTVEADKEEIFKNLQEGFIGKGKKMFEM